MKSIAAGPLGTEGSFECFYVAHTGTRRGLKSGVAPVNQPKTRPIREQLREKGVF